MSKGGEVVQMLLTEFWRPLFNDKGRVESLIFLQSTSSFLNIDNHELAVRIHTVGSAVSQ